MSSADTQVASCMGWSTHWTKYRLTPKTSANCNIAWIRLFLFNFVCSSYWLSVFLFCNDIVALLNIGSVSCFLELGCISWDMKHGKEDVLCLLVDLICMLHPIFLLLWKVHTILVRNNYWLYEKGLCILKEKEEFIYTRNRHVGPALTNR